MGVKEVTTFSETRGAIYRIASNLLITPIPLAEKEHGLGFHSIHVILPLNRVMLHYNHVESSVRARKLNTALFIGSSEATELVGVEEDRLLLRKELSTPTSNNNLYLSYNINNNKMSYILGRKKVVIPQNYMVYVMYMYSHIHTLLHIKNKKGTFFYQIAVGQLKKEGECSTNENKRNLYA